MLLVNKIKDAINFMLKSDGQKSKNNRCYICCNCFNWFFFVFSVVDNKATEKKSRLIIRNTAMKPKTADKYRILY